MATKKHNKKLSKNIYGDGGWSTMTNAQKTGAITGAVGEGLSLVTQAINNAQVKEPQELDAALKNQNSYKVSAADNLSLLNEMNTYQGIQSLDKNAFQKSGGEIASNILGSVGAGAAGGAAFGGIGAGIGAAAGLLTSGAAEIAHAVKAKKMRNDYNKKIQDSNNLMQTKFNNTALNIDTTSDLSRLANFGAEGGYVDNNSPFATIINNGGTHEENPFEGVQMGVDTHGIPNLVEENEVIWDNYVFSDRLKIPKQATNTLKVKENMSFAEAAKKILEESKERPNDPISKTTMNTQLSMLRDYQTEVKNKKERQKINREFNKLSVEDKMGLMGLANQQSQQPMQYKYGGRIAHKYDGETNTSSFMVPPPINYSAGQQQQISDYMKGNNGWFDRNYTTLLRGVPALMNLGMVVTDALGLTNKPDYSHYSYAENALKNMPTITPQKLSNYLSYNPIDTNYLYNKLNADSRSTARNIMNISGGNRGNATAALLANSLNNQTALGNLGIEAAKNNAALKENVAKHNLGVNQSNIENALNAFNLNSSVRQNSLNALIEIGKRKEAIDAIVGSNKSTNLNNLITSIANIGQEIDNREALLFNTIDKLGLDYIAKKFGINTAMSQAQKRGMNFDDFKTLMETTFPKK